MKKPTMQLVLWMRAGHLTVRAEKSRDEVLRALAEIILAAAQNAHDEERRAEEPDERR